MSLTKILYKLKLNKDINYTQYLRSLKNLSELDIIRHSYDLQTGSYLKRFFAREKKYIQYTNEISQVINSNFKNFRTMIDCGCGEMTVSYLIIKRLISVKKFFLCDISLNRMMEGKKFLRKKLNKTLTNKLNFFCTSLDKIPFKDNSIDLIFTSHALEPNKIKSINIIKELYRISKKGLIFCEPDYTTASREQKKRMKKNNYVQNIPGILRKLDFKFTRIKLKNSLTKTNQTTCFIIHKQKKIKNNHQFVDPFFKQKIKKIKNYYFSNYLNQIFFIYKDIVMFDFDKPTILSKKNL